jgi:KDO2-lipid IV(A) lauroyltransferase
MSTLKRRWKHRLEYVGYRLMSLIFGALPIERAAALGAALVGWLGPKSRKRHPRMLRNIATALPELDEAEREILGVKVWRNLGYVLGEFFHLNELTRDRVEVENSELLESLAKSGKGVVFCGAHQANWEIASVVLRDYGFKSMGVYHPMSNAYVDADVRARRIDFYAGGLVSKHDPATPMAMLRHVRGGGAAAFLVDQQIHMGLMTPFFGRPAATTPFPALAARQCDAPLVLLSGSRLPGSRFRMKAELIPTPRTDDRNADILAATTIVQAELEKTIRQHPEQWMWTHDRWK